MSGTGVWSRGGWLVSSLIFAGLLLIGWERPYHRGPQDDREVNGAVAPTLLHQPVNIDT